MTIKIVIADDHLIIRQGLKLILDTESDFDLVGEAGDGAEALQICAQTHPQVVLMDLRMPGMDGLTAIEKLHVDQPETAVVILTTFNEDDLLIRGLQAGAKGYLLKDTTRETLFNAIRAAARGETLLSPETMLRLLNQVERPSRLVNDDINLTEREQQVLKAVALGERSKEVAFKLGISERTVKAHLASIYNKLGVDSRAAAIAIAAQRGWLKE
ncbi:MAG: response regulator transcription factor [Anaerolineaceae bacterium]|nr:response regulator transcription factor [Anaerolineaceae bacterium]